MQDILLSRKQFFSLIKRLDEINADVASLKFRSLPDVGFIDTYELLKLLQVTVRTVQRWRKSGNLPYSKIGGRYYYKADIIRDSFKMCPGQPVDSVDSVDPVVPVVPVVPVGVGPLEVEFPPPVIDLSEAEVEVMACQRCPLLLIFNS